VKKQCHPSTAVSQGSGKTVSLKAQPTGFLGFIGFWALLGFFQISYLNKQLGSSLVDLAHQLSFYLDMPIL